MLVSSAVALAGLLFLTYEPRPVDGALRFSNVLGSHMVLQRDRPAPVWGWDAPGSEITIDAVGVSHQVTANQNGFWRTELPPQSATTNGVTIRATSASGTAVLTDVVFGEVILCSGQSNMEFVVPAAMNATAEIEAADNYPHIRLFTGPMQGADHLAPDPSVFNVTHDEALFVRMNWSVASAKVVGGCSDHTNPTCDTCCGNPIAKKPFGTGSYVSAVCWFAARDLADMLGGNIPVGGIDQSYGGTSIQFWMSSGAIAASNAPEATQCCGQNGGPSCLFNTQIYPYTLGPMQFGAAIFYQGEQNANCGGPTQVANGTYATMLRTMVQDWRSLLAQPNLPFGTVLLAPWKGRADLTSFPLLRLAQIKAATMSQVFVINSLDQGDPINPEVHSPYKQAVGRRAALGIAAVSGLNSNVPFKGPTYASAAVGSDKTSVEVVVETATLYDSPLIINTSIECPVAVTESRCESFAVLSSAGCTWHAAEVKAGSTPSMLQLLPGNWSGGVPLATRAYFANWPVASVQNSVGIPLVPWLECINEARSDGSCGGCPLPSF